MTKLLGAIGEGCRPGVGSNTRQGRSKIPKAFLLVAVLAGAVALILNVKPDSCPVSVKYIGNASFTNGGSVLPGLIVGDVLSGPTFWLTNNTSKSLLVLFHFVEVRAGTNWILCGNPQRALMLGPDDEGYVTVEFAYQQYPTNQWRLKGITSEQLTGSDAVLSFLRHYPGMLWDAFVKRNWSIQLNPFAKKLVWFGNNHEILSPTVIDSNSIRSDTSQQN